MIIAAWNIERLKHKKDIDKILNACDQIKADILVLTETDKQVQPNYKYSFETPSPYETNPSLYKPTENRVSIFTNYPCIQQYETYDKYTSICAELDTEKGNLTVYATIMGIYGNRHPTFKEDLLKQTADFKNIAAAGKNLCIIGDFNCSFADNYYFTTFGRNTLLKAFEENKIRLLTGSKRECADQNADNEKKEPLRQISKTVFPETVLTGILLINLLDGKSELYITKHSILKIIFFLSKSSTKMR